ncbi:hypothetical protein H8D29_04675 [PVC group bacterium]|nr:hypothetical protein [PVC group bacterium]
MLAKIPSFLFVLLLCLCTDAHAVDQGTDQTSESLAVRLLKEGSLTEEISGAAMVEFDGKMALVAVGEGVPQDGTAGAVAERTARYAAFIVAKGELIKFLKGMEINAKTEVVKKFVIKDTIDGSSAEIEETITESYNAFCEGILRAVVSLSSTYDHETKVARVVVISIPEDARGFNRLGPGVRVVDSLDNAMNSLEREAVLGVIPPTGGTIVIVKDGTSEETWLVGWGSDVTKGPIRIAGLKARSRAGRALLSFAKGTEVEVKDSFSSEFSKSVKQLEQSSSEFYSDNNKTLIKERTQSSRMVIAKATGVVTVLRQAKRVGSSDWVMAIVGFKYILSKPGTSFPPARWGGLSPSLDSAFNKAREWSLSLKNPLGIGTSAAYGTRADLPWGVGVSVAPIPEKQNVKEELTDSLKMMARAAAVRGLAIAMGKKNRETVEANIAGGIRTQVYDDHGLIRVFVLISRDEVQDIQTSGKLIETSVLTN